MNTFNINTFNMTHHHPTLSQHNTSSSFLLISTKRPNFIIILELSQLKFGLNLFLKVRKHKKMTKIRKISQKRNEIRKFGFLSTQRCHLQ